MKNKCPAYWRDITLNKGTYEICLKCNPKKGTCAETGQRCPYQTFGVKYIEDQHCEVREWLKEKSRLGARRSHGIE